ncbi:hypothetical protein ACFP2T_19615 [Plantactinospora solaniradicis]|uniref:Uncharacterized protein n=1 Tax=Plantactinospora solaniradicis TaxID=1723736 RepID=A0ABW1KAZ0_9ACTN
MPQILVQVGFTPLPEDDDFVLDQLTEELADDLRGIGEVHRVESSVRDRDSKGVAELVLGTVTVLLGTDSGYAQALVELVVCFINRNNGRRVQLKVGDIELSIDRPTKAQNDELIRMVRDAIERSR